MDAQQTKDISFKNKKRLAVMALIILRAEIATELFELDKQGKDEILDYQLTKEFKAFKELIKSVDSEDKN